MESSPRVLPLEALVSFAKYSVTLLSRLSMAVKGYVLVQWLKNHHMWRSTKRASTR